MNLPLRCFAQLAAILVAFAATVSGSAEPSAAWNRFRGPNGTGIARDADVPAAWAPSACAWSAELPGQSHSSPVGWGDRLFVTTADPRAGTQLLLALDATTGTTLWTARHEAAPYRVHAANSLASSSPAADAEHVYVAWATPEQAKLVAFTHTGQEVWACDLGPYESQHGYGTSPAPMGDVVLLAHDNLGASHVTAIAAADGSVRWRVPRAAGTSAYATPACRTAADGTREAVVHSTAEGMAGLRLVDGSVAWRLADAFPVRCVSSPLVVGELVLGCSGEGGSGKSLVCVRPPSGAAGTVAVQYDLRKSVPQAPTVVARDELLFIWSDRGIVTCCDLATGKTHWQQRVGGRYYGSPIVAGDKLIAVSEEGEVVSLAASREYALRGRVPLDEMCHSTPAVHNGMLVVRTASHLYAVESAEEQR